jgi:hypothetical protein
MQAQRSDSVARGPGKLVYLSRDSIDRRTRERPDHHSPSRPTDPGRSGALGPLLAADAEASVYVGKPCRLSVAGRAQRQAPTRGGRRVLSRGGRRPATYAFPSRQAQGREAGHTITQGQQ